VVGGAVRRLRDPSWFRRDPGRAPTATPAVGLVGFYGAGNYGDELFLEVFRAWLGAPLRLHPLLDSRPGKRRFVTRANARQLDAIVIGGGDIVVPWRTGRYWQRAFLDRPVFIAGAGVPSSTTQRPRSEAIANLRAFFRHRNVMGISARDPESAAWIRSELQPRAPVVEIPDLVCALDLPPAPKPDGPPIFGVAVRHRDPVDDLSQVQAMCRRALELGYRLRRIVLATGPLRPVDEAATVRLGFDDAELVSSDDLDTISRAIGECAVLATMKFHGVVVATSYRVPSIVLMPSAKTVRFAARIGRPDAVTHFGDPNLPARVPVRPEPLPAGLPAQLRAPVVAYLDELRSRILEIGANGYP
jgi:polysaccharide pyruvyl transferase WcaK-like protein